MSAAGRAFGPDAIRTLREHLPFALVALGYAVVGVTILSALDRPVAIPLAKAYRIPVLVTIIYLLASLLVIVLGRVFVRGDAPLAGSTWRGIARRWLPPDRVLGTLLVLALLPAFLAVMLGFRTALTSFQPFVWDPALAELDRWLHFGRDPWELLQPLFGRAGFTRALDAFYVYGWFSMLWAGVAWQTVHGKEPLRQQFLLAFVLTWIVLGTIVAIAFSSAGPVYYGRVTGLTDPFDPLMTYLASVDAQNPLRALAVQERLWGEYTEWGGITAMPSMHLAQTTVVFLAAARAHRRLGAIAGLALLLILLGSVHLGWHYAVDAYAGILGAVGIWWLAGRIVRRFGRYPATEASRR